MAPVTRNILTGLLTLLPISLTLYLLYWLIVTTERVLGAMLPQAIYFPGMGVATALLISFGVGVMMHTWVARNLFKYSEQLFLKLPVVRLIYPPIRDFFDYFSPLKKKTIQQVVAFKVPGTELEMVGLITQTDEARMPRDFGTPDNIMVYLPMSYQIGGYAFLVPRDAVRPLDISMDEAMRYILTAGVAGITPGSPSSAATTPTPDESSEDNREKGEDNR